MSKRTILITLTLLTLAPLTYILAHVHIDRTPTAAAGDTNLHQLIPLWITSALTILALTLLWRALMCRVPNLKSEISNLKSSALFILTLAALARLAILLTHTPSLSDDIHRYTFDGNNLVHAQNPYTIIPTDRAAELRAGAAPHFAAESDVIALMNNREMSTIYLPFSQYTFAAIATLTSDDLPTPAAHARLIRAWFILLDLLLIGLLLYTLHQRNQSPWFAALYAFHPLPLIEVAGSGHQDIIGIALLFTTLLIYTHHPHKTIRWTIPLALSALVKPFVIPITLALIWRAHTMLAARLRHTIIALLTGITICLALSAPLLLTQGGAPLHQLTDTAQRFSLKWAHFGSFYEPLLYTIEQATNPPDEYWQTPDTDPRKPTLWSNDHQEQLARIICTALIAIIITILIFSRLDHWRCAAAMLFTMILLSPTVHPWYLLWPFALFPIIAAKNPKTQTHLKSEISDLKSQISNLQSSSPLWIAALTLPLAYHQFADVITWQTSTWVYCAAYIPIYFALLVCHGRARAAVRARNKRPELTQPLTPPDAHTRNSGTAATAPDRTA